MSTSRWHYENSGNHHRHCKRMINDWTRFQCNPSNSCSDVSGWTKVVDWLTERWHCCPYSHSASMAKLKKTKNVTCAQNKSVTETYPVLLCVQVVSVVHLDACCIYIPTQNDVQSVSSGFLSLKQLRGTQLLQGLNLQPLPYTGITLTTQLWWHCSQPWWHSVTNHSSHHCTLLTFVLVWTCLQCFSEITHNRYFP